MVIFGSIPHFSSIELSKWNDMPFQSMTVVTDFTLMQDAEKIYQHLASIDKFGLLYCFMVYVPGFSKIVL